MSKPGGAVLRSMLEPLDPSLAIFERRARLAAIDAWLAQVDFRPLTKGGACFVTPGNIPGYAIAMMNTDWMRTTLMLRRLNGAG